MLVFCLLVCKLVSLLPESLLEVKDLIAQLLLLFIFLLDFGLVSLTIPLKRLQQLLIGRIIATIILDTLVSAASRHMLLR